MQADKLGGNIQCTSPWPPGQGTTGTAFKFTLPLLQSESGTPLPVTSLEVAAPALVPTLPRGIHVLVADDMGLNRRLLRRALTLGLGLDWTVEEAVTAEEVLKKVTADHTFDLLVIDEIFSDVDLDCMRGSTAVKRLREREASESMPRLAVIACTGSKSRDVFECGADTVWGKPFPKTTDGSMQCSVASVIPHLCGIPAWS